MLQGVAEGFPRVTSPAAATMDDASDIVEAIGRPRA